MYGFEWHRTKAKANERKHGESFVEAAGAFEDPRSLTMPTSGIPWTKSGSS